MPKWQHAQADRMKSHPDVGLPTVVVSSSATLTLQRRESGSFDLTSSNPIFFFLFFQLGVDWVIELVRETGF